MEKKTLLQIRVGVFVSVGLLLTMIMIFLLGGQNSLFERHYTLYVRFNNISGLRIGASVFLAGITVGTVDNIRFPQDLKEQAVEVKLKIANRFRDRIREDSKAAITTQGLLGDKVVQITVGSPELPEMKSDQIVPAKKTGISLEGFAEQGGDFLKEVTELVSNVDTIVKDIHDKQSLIHALIYDSKGADIVPRLASIGESSAKIVKEIEKGKGFLHGMIYEPVDPDVAKNLSSTIDSLKKVSQNLSQITGKIEKGEGSIGGLINDPTVYYDLKTLMGKANRSKLIQSVIRYTLLENEKDIMK